MKSRITSFSILVIILSVFVSCGKKPETIVSDLYTSIYNGEWEKASPMILPDSLENLTPDEIKFLGEEFNRYYPKGRAFETVKVDSASYNEEKNEIAYTVTVNFNDSTSFTETGTLKKNAEGNWELTDYMPKEGEKLPFEITLFDFPLEMKPNLKRAMIKVGAERNIPAYQYYAAPYYLYAPYPVDKNKYDELLKKSSEAGYIPAISERISGYNVSYDTPIYDIPKEYIEFIKQAVALGSLEAKAKYAFLQRRGMSGIPKDLKGAQEAFQKALEAGIGDGGFGLGYMYGWGEIGGKRDYVKALEYLKKGAELGSKDANYYIYLCYDYGKGTQRDKEEAEKWLRRHQNQRDGYKDFIFKNGSYFNSDPEERFEADLYKIKMGDPSAYIYHQMGEKYEFGKGVEQDLEKAKYCYSREAALSSKESKVETIRMRGFEQNPVIPLDEFKEIYK